MCVISAIATKEIQLSKCTSMMGFRTKNISFYGRRII